MTNSSLGDPEYIWRLMLAAELEGCIVKRSDVVDIIIRHSGCGIRWAKRIIQLGIEQGCWEGPDGRTRAHRLLKKHPDGTELRVRSLEERKLSGHGIGVGRVLRQKL